MKAKIFRILLAVTMTITLILTAACNTTNNTPDAPPAQNNATDVTDIGQGAKVFLFEVTDGEGNTTSWNVHTDAATVGDALLEIGLIEGTMFDFGLMVEYVNGIRADFTEDGAWWAFHIDGEMAMAGVDSIEIEEGVVYAFVYTPA